MNCYPIFINILSDDSYKYFTFAFNLFCKFKSKLFDDFCDVKFKNDFDAFLDLLISLDGHFWFIIDGNFDSFAGFVFLDEWIGSKSQDGFDNFHFANINVCFEKKYWGNFVRKAGEIFIPFIFDSYNIHKLGASIYNTNNYVKKLLSDLNFKFEAILHNHTVVNNKFVDICLYYIEKQ